MINIYIGNLPYSVSDDELSDLFRQYGTINKATIVTDRETGRSKGFGFVEMTEDEAGQNAIAALHGNPFRGRPLTVNEARPRGSGTGERVLGDGSGGSATAPDHGRGHDEGERPAYRPADEPAVPKSNGYRNTLLARSSR